MASLFGRDGCITRIGEHIPIVNNGIQELHARAGNGEALHRARHANPIGAHGSITKAAEYIPGVNKVVQVAHSAAGQPEALLRAQGHSESPPEVQNNELIGNNSAVRRDHVIDDSEPIADHNPICNNNPAGVHIAVTQSNEYVSGRFSPLPIANVFGRDGFFTRVGEHIPVVNNGIQQLHFRAGSDEALHRARQANPIGAHGIITKAVEYVPVVNNIVQAAHVAAGQPEALSRARSNDPIGANGSVTQVAERIPVISSFVQVLHEHSGQEAALQRAQEHNPFAKLAAASAEHPESLFEMSCSYASGLSFEKRVLENGTQCWTDLGHAVCINVPDALVGATLFAGPYNGVPSGCLTLSVGAPIRVYIFAEAGKQDGGVASLGWQALPADAGLSVTLGEETVLSAWCCDYIIFEERCSIQIPLTQPWVGFVALRMLPDQSTGGGECPAACPGPSELPMLDMAGSVEGRNKPFYDMIHASMAEALARDASEPASGGQEAIFQQWLRHFHSEHDDEWYGKNYTRVNNAFRPHWEQILEQQQRHDHQNQGDRQLHLHHGNSAGSLYIGGGVPRADADREHAAGVSSTALDLDSEFAEVRASIRNHSDESGDLSRDWHIC